MKFQFLDDAEARTSIKTCIKRLAVMEVSAGGIPSTAFLVGMMVDYYHFAAAEEGQTISVPREIIHDLEILADQVLKGEDDEEEISEDPA